MNADDYGQENAKLRFEVATLKLTLEAAMSELRMLRAFIKREQPEVGHDS